MAGINWTSSSINSFFRTSLNQNNSGMNNLYSLLGDKAMIKSGSYHKLMDAYVKKMKTEEAESAKEKTKVDKNTDTVKSDSKNKNTTYNSTGAKDKISTDSILDTLI